MRQTRLPRPRFRRSTPWLTIPGFGQHRVGLTRKRFRRISCGRRTRAPAGSLLIRITTIDPSWSDLGLVVIAALYISVGVMSAAGTVYIAKSIFSARSEPVFFGLF